MKNDITSIKPSQARSLLKLNVRANVPTFLWGPPGVGKSQITNQVAESLGYGVVDIRLSQLDPVDLHGLPHINGDGMTAWTIPDILPQPERDGQRGILFLDEMNTAPASMLAAAYQLVLDRRVGGYRLPDGWTVIASGNRESDRGVATRMPTPLSNRFAHYDVTTDINDWSSWALGPGGISTEIVAFLRFRRELLHNFDPRSGEKAFPTPRSWEMTDRVYRAQPDPDDELLAFAAIVGQAAAIEFTGFLRFFRTMPSIDGIMVDPAGSAVPDEPATKYAVSLEISRRADANNIDRVWAYADRMGDEFAVLTMSSAVARDPSLKQTRAFIGFATKYSDIV
jgi:MoxR-like ATPase